MIKINKNSDIDNVINNNEDGCEATYVVITRPSRKIERQVLLTKELRERGQNAFIEVKFHSKYSSRERRLEVVSTEKGSVSIYKFSDSSHYDKDSFDLQRITLELKETYQDKSIVFNGVVLMGNESDTSFFSKSLINDCPSITIKKLQDYGIFT